MAEKLGIVVAKFNHEITVEMSKTAQKRAKELGAKIIKIAEVPGSFEIPFAAKRLLENKNIDGVVTIGAIIKGGTDHDKVIAHSIAKKLLDLSCRYNKPVSLGVIGPNATWQQAKKRAKDYGKRAVDAVVEMLRKG